MKILIKVQSPEEIDIRIDKFISSFHKIKNLGFSRTFIQNMIKNGEVFKNSIVFTDINYKTKIDDEFLIDLPEKKELEKIKPNKIPLNIIYEDDDLIVINKQAGLTVHPGAGNDKNTLVNSLMDLYGDNLSDMGDETRRGILHRLDKDTTGLMVIAKNNKAHILLAQQLEERELKRNYIAFIWKTLSPRKGLIELNMDRCKGNHQKMEVREDGRYSKSNYEIKETYANRSVSKVIFELDTGRTHQIRLHCASKGCPLIGDKMYGGTSRHLKAIYPQDVRDFVDIFPRQALHSFRIKFFQPITGEPLSFETELPEDMRELENVLKKLK